MADALPAGPRLDRLLAGAAASNSLAGGDDQRRLRSFVEAPVQAQEIAAAIGLKRVVLKPNNVIIGLSAMPRRCRIPRGHPRRFLHSIGKTDIVIAESPANGSAMDGFANYGYDKLAAKYHVKLVNLDNEGYEVVYVVDQKDMQPHAVRVAKMLMDPANNFVISAAKLKTHDLVGITLSLKNIVVGSGIKDSGAGLNRRGSNSGPLGQAPHARRRHLRHQLQPVHAIGETASQPRGDRRLRGPEGTGPVNGTPVHQKVCLASMDWLAADAKARR